MAGNIWVLAEQWKGQISEITYEVLALGKEVAAALGVDVQVALLGYEVKDLAQGLGRAKSVLYLNHPALASPVPQAHARALAALARERHPAAILIPLTNVTWELGTLLAAQLEVGYVNSCRDVRVVDSHLEASSVLYGGKMEAVVSPTQAPAILGVLPGARPGAEGWTETAPLIEEVQVALEEISGLRLKRYLEPEAGDIDITKQEVLISVGRGIQSRDNVSLAEELAGSLGGAVCGSRPVIDQGWLPLSRQVGKSGAIVKPKLYVAAGISGAPEHVEGMKNSALIIAINSDPQAPIFNVAHYGIATDAVALLPALTEAVRSKKEVESHA